MKGTGLKPWRDTGLDLLFAPPLAPNQEDNACLQNRTHEPILAVAIAERWTVVDAFSPPVLQIGRRLLCCCLFLRWWLPSRRLYRGRGWSGYFATDQFEFSGWQNS